ncbi:MAG TPA: lysylphosphatidylglycerol synthase transmembrane domain-containing protein [Pilimelia sp.]|nr:lysylphosphatidylglycerol synthase transmembrane domain-containing protein [Pilimelia sp.]
MSRRAWAWVRVLGGAGILAVVLWRLGTAAFLAGWRVTDAGTLLAALGIGVLTTVLSAWRWCLVARGLGLRLPLGGAVADYYRALFLNAALPGGVLGDVHRAVRHGQDVGDVGRGVRAVVLERTAGQAVLVVVGATALLIRPPGGLSPADLGVPPAVAAVAAAGIAAGVLAALRLRRRDSRWRRAWRAALSDIRLGLLAPGSWPGVAVSSVLVLAGHLATFLIAARAAGSAAPTGQLVPLLLLALLAMALPLNIGGWGPREGVCAWAFGAAGLGAAQGLTTAVVYGLCAFVASLPGAGVLVVRWRTGPRRPAAATRADQSWSAPNRSDSA